MIDLEQKRKQYEKIGKIGALGIAGFLVAPFIFFVIKGIIGLAIAAGVGLLLVNVGAPWFGSKLANWKLKALKHEASLNPIETLQNEHLSRMEKLQQFRDYIREFAAQVSTFAGKLDEFKEKFPKDAAQFDEQHQQMVALLSLRKNKYEEAKNNLSAFESEIQKAQAIWDMAQAAAKLNQAAGVNTDEFYAKIQVETALDSVQKSLGASFADLEISLLDEKQSAPKATATTPTKQVSNKSNDPLALFIESPMATAPVKGKIQV